MATGICNRWLRWAAAGLAVVALAGGNARANDNDKEVIEDLRKRMEQLEKQNQQLMEMLKRMAPPAEPDEVALPEPRVEPAGPPRDTAPDSNARVRKIVGDYLKEKDEEKKKEEEKKKAEAEAEGWEIGKHFDLKGRFDGAYWYLESPDKAFRFHVGGRTQADAVWMASNPGNALYAPLDRPIQDAVNFRRARLEVDGTLWEVIDFFMEYDFLNTFENEPSLPNQADLDNVPVPTDLWITLTHLPWVGNCRIGNQKPPISLEHLTSSRYLDFLERSLCFDAFIGGLNNGFQPGISFFNWFADERATWHVGMFKHSNNVMGWNFGNGEWEATGRLTWLPYYANEGRCLVHLGLGASYQTADNDKFFFNQLRYRARTLLRNGPAAAHATLVDLNMNGAANTMLVPELIVQVGPFFVQAEYYAVWAHDIAIPIDAPVNTQINKGTGYYSGGYVQALYFLTGEHRLYNRRYRENRRLATFDRVIPDENFFCVHGSNGRLISGCGAWQIGARYSWIDLNSDPVSAGFAQDVTLGLNWFLNPNMKLQWNYIIETRDDLPASVQADGFVDSTVHGFGMRLAIDF